MPAFPRQSPACALGTLRAYARSGGALPCGAPRHAVLKRRRCGGGSIAACVQVAERGAAGSRLPFAFRACAVPISLCSDGAPASAAGAPAGAVAALAGASAAAKCAASAPAGAAVAPVGAVSAPVGAVDTPAGAVGVPVGAVDAPVGVGDAPAGAVAAPRGAVERFRVQWT